MTARLPARGFWSYARKDDDYSDRRVSQLYDRVRKEVVLDYGKPVDIFQDTSDITKGAVWEARIRGAIANSAFLIPVITPTFLQRPWCFREVSLFLEREKELQARHPELLQESLIFPIGYREIRDEEALDRDLMAILRGRQWAELEELIDLDLQDPQIRREVRKLVSGVSRLLRIPVEAETERDARAAVRPVNQPSPDEADVAAIPEFKDEALREAGKDGETQAEPDRRPIDGARRSGVASEVTESLRKMLSVFMGPGGGPSWRRLWALSAVVALGGLLLVIFVGRFGQPATTVKPSIPDNALESSPVTELQDKSGPAGPGLNPEDSSRPSPQPPVSGEQIDDSDSAGPQTGAAQLMETQPPRRRGESVVARTGRDVPEGVRAGVARPFPEIQLGAFPDETAAANAWRALTARFRYLAPLSHQIVPGRSGSRTVYRLFASGPQAAVICRRLRAAGEACITSE